MNLTFGHALKALIFGALAASTALWLLVTVPRLGGLLHQETGFIVFMAIPMFLSGILMVSVATVAALVLGLPIYEFVVRRIGVTWLTSIAMGVACGSALMALWPLTPASQRGIAILWGGAMGFIGGLAFYLSARASNKSLERSREP
jgi:hypothetical protein